MPTFSVDNTQKHSKKSINDRVEINHLEVTSQLSGTAQSVDGVR